MHRVRWLLTAHGVSLLTVSLSLSDRCENKSFPNMIVSINTHGDRIYVGDVAVRPPALNSRMFDACLNKDVMNDDCLIMNIW